MPTPLIAESITAHLDVSRKIMLAATELTYSSSSMAIVTMNTAINVISPNSFNEATAFNVCSLIFF